MISTYSILIIIFTLISLSPITVLSDFVTEDGIKVQLFKQKSKKPIPLKSYTNNTTSEYGFQEYEIEVKEPIEKIVLSGMFEDNLEDLSYKITITNLETQKVVLFKDIITFGYDNRTYSFPLVPWIGSLTKVPYIENKGQYLILIERNNMLNETGNRMLSIKYTIV
jgi:hypothetical protein